MPGSRRPPGPTPHICKGTDSPLPPELECLVLETILSKEWDQPWPWSAEPCRPLSAPRGHSAPTVNPHSPPAMYTHHSQLPWRDRQEMFIEREVKLDLPANRTLTHERVDWPQGTVLGPGHMVEKQPPLEPRVSPADPGRDPPVAPMVVSGEQRQEGIWELQPCRGIVGHRTPGKPTTRQGSPCAHPSPGPHPHHPCPRGQNKN